MKKSDILLALLVIVVLGLAWWAFSSGRFNATVGAWIDQAWSSMEGLLRPIFNR